MAFDREGSLFTKESGERLEGLLVAPPPDGAEGEEAAAAALATLASTGSQVPPWLLDDLRPATEVGLLVTSKWMCSEPQAGSVIDSGRTMVESSQLKKQLKKCL